MHSYPIPQKREIAYIRVTTPIISPRLVISGITMLLGSMPFLYAKEAMIKSRTNEETIITQSVNPVMYRSVRKEGIATPVIVAPQ